jgi:hypothetical protein
LADADLIRMPEPIPDVIRVDPNAGVRFTPNELRALKAESGQSMTELFQDGDDADRTQVMVWLALRRQGRIVAWDRCGDIAVDLVSDPPDPSSAASLTSSPHSADSGDSPPAT